MSKRRWKAPNNPTHAARAVWAELFPGHPWPTGWRVEWAGFMRGALGMTIYSERRVLLSYGDAKVHHRHGRSGPVEVLLHEFVHLRSRGLRHGVEFRSLENGLRSRLGFPPKEIPA